MELLVDRRKSGDQLAPLSLERATFCPPATTTFWPMTTPRLKNSGTSADGGVWFTEADAGEVTAVRSEPVKKGVMRVRRRGG